MTDFVNASAPLPKPPPAKGTPGNIHHLSTTSGDMLADAPAVAAVHDNAPSEYKPDEQKFPQVGGLDQGNGIQRTHGLWFTECWAEAWASAMEDQWNDALNQAFDAQAKKMSATKKNNGNPEPMRNKSNHDGVVGRLSMMTKLSGTQTPMAR